MFCEKCGSPLERGEKYCSKCGAATGKDFRSYRREEESMVSQGTYANAAVMGGVDAQALSVGDYIKTMLLMAVPVLGLVLTFLWGFAKGEINPNKRNLARAYLVFYLIWTVFLVVASSAFIGLFRSLLWYF